MKYPIYTDASSAILLHRVDLFKQLARYASLIFVPAVYDEVIRKDRPGAQMFDHAVHEEHVHLTKRPEAPDSSKYPEMNTMGAGEKETISLYIKTGKGFILTDDGKAARFCHRQTLPFINALLVPKLFWFAGITGEKTCMEHMQQLCREGRYSEKVISIAHDLACKDLEYFIQALTS